MSYTVVMLTFMEDIAVRTHPLKDLFPSIEAAKEAGAREIAVSGARPGEMGFQVFDPSGKMVYDGRRGQVHG
jgi:hypothetical protein